ncbi:18882_t:CDS:2 [Dentiscutata erythropus]|uniref:18882_t:CDS:1 n=1 Tax=Dentiscutata erythropus TaxID=1348616 RepID=A0A9N9JL79_9GLOM|nr:18882_t:CDS:2 [Dentiscutata erythropus]
MDLHTLNTTLFSLAAKLECIAIHACGSVCNECTEFLIELSNLNLSQHNVIQSALYSSMPARTTWHINDQCEVWNIVDNE